jgi:hypothetical protein
MQWLWSFTLGINNFFWNLSCWDWRILFIYLSISVKVRELFGLLRERFFLN